MINKKKVLIGVGIGVVLAFLLVGAYFAGVHVGRRGESRFFSPWNRNYRNNSSRRFGHGLVGSIKFLSKDSLVIKDRTGNEKTVTTDNQTKIIKNGKSIKFSDLKVNDQVAVLGEPDQTGKGIKAKIIRIINFNQQTGVSLFRNYRFSNS